MTIHRNLNQGGLGGNYTTWYLWNEMLNAGHVVVSSGSGVGGAYSAAADVYDHAINPVIGANVTQIGVAIGSEHWGNQRCWVLLEAPDGTQIVIQRGNTVGNAGDDEWAYSYSPGGIFSMAAANNQTAPVAPDQRDLVGTLNAVWPSYHQVGNVANLIHIAVDDALSPEGFSGFICVEFVTVNKLYSMCMVDDLRSVPSGGLFAPHAKTFHFVGNGAAIVTQGVMSSTVNAPIALVDYGGGTESWDVVPYHLITDSAGTLYPGAAGAPTSGEVPVPMFVGGRTHGGFGGLSRWLEWQAVTRPYNDRSTAEDRWYIDDVEVKVLPDGVTIPNTI
jgi:hypothetical protein